MSTTTKLPLSTGLAGLDHVIEAVLPGDNIVWQVDAIEDYAAFVAPFYATALRAGHKLVYFRFARHPQLVPDDAAAEIHRLSPEVGFERFTADIHNVIERAGRGAFYVFDCLSDLAADWYSDLMLGNFFMVTCPYLYELETVTYFALLRDRNSIEAVSAIRGTTQILIDLFRHDGKLYVHPLKVDGRQSTTMYLPHVQDDGAFRPLTESAVLSEMLVQITEQRLDSASRTLDIWDRTFMRARTVLDGVMSGTRPPRDAQPLVEHLLRMMVTRDEGLIPLALRHFDLSDLLAIRKRMIGTGLIGGKSVGMLLARAILCKTDKRWRARLERHDSFFIGSDVFYTFLVRNGCWPIRRTQRSQTSFLDGAEDAQERIRAGTFPPFIREQFVAMLEYFGQSPIIVRSSSLQEDSIGNAFTGKYESVFCPNQGSPEERLSAFLSAVLTVYASTMSKEALLYRAHRGLLDSDEQMAILVQRVSGTLYGDLFFPHLAGVGLSYNPYVWNEEIDPEAGVLRLVFGLGTRAVDRSDDDYTRVIALNAPLRRPEGSFDEVMDYAQRRVDVINLAANRFASLQSDEVFSASPGLPVEMFASRQALRERRRSDTHTPPWVLTFDRLLSETPFVEDLRAMLAALHRAYDYHVDVEYTANFLSDGSYRINLVQCRPLQVKGGGRIVPPLEGLRPDDLVLAALGTVIGPSTVATVDRLIYVVPAAYAALPVSDRFSIGRMIGRLTHPEGAEARPETVMLLGPGRWGTSTPSLGVPVSFAEINTVSVLCEIVTMGVNLVPDVSLGTHFFNDLVEANMLYIAVYPDRAGNSLNEAFLERQPNRLADLSPDDACWAEVVRVIDAPTLTGGRTLCISADCLTQKAVCYLGSPPSS
jgi:pyruvate,water dikinase